MLNNKGSARLEFLMCLDSYEKLFLRNVFTQYRSLLL